MLPFSEGGPRSWNTCTVRIPVCRSQQIATACIFLGLEVENPGVDSRPAMSTVRTGTAGSATAPAQTNAKAMSKLVFAVKNRLRATLQARMPCRKTTTQMLRHRVEAIFYKGGKAPAIGPSLVSRAANNCRVRINRIRQTRGPSKLHTPEECHYQYDEPSADT